MSFHPRAGTCEGLSADRPRPTSGDRRSPVTGLASPDRRRANPSAISRALNPMTHKRPCSDDVTPAVADRCTPSLVLMRLLPASFRRVANVSVSGVRPAGLFARVAPFGFPWLLLLGARGVR